MMRALRWAMAGVALEGCWLFACEAMREPSPVLLAVIAAVSGLLLAVAWHAVVQPRTRIAGALWLVGALVVFDQVLDLVSPYPARFGLLGWEAVRAAALIVGFALASPVVESLPRWLRVAAVIAAGASLVLALLVPSTMLYLALDGSRDRTEPADAALVLGYALADDGTPQPQLVGRMEHAIDLVQRGVVPKLVLSGGASKHGRTEASVMRDLARAAGVPADALVLDEAARSTIENFACSRALLDRLGARRVLVVTEPWHMTRAMLLARRHGLDALASPARSAIWSSPRAAGYWLFRDAVAYLRELARDPFAEPGICGAPDCEGCRKF